MKDFSFYNPTRIIFGKNSLNELPNELKKYGKKVMITFGSGSIRKSGIYNKLIEQLKGFIVEEFWGLEPNPRVETVRKVLIIARKFKPDILLAVGGGSVIDGTKLLSASYYYKGDPWDIVLAKGSNITKALPFATILTVAATGSEMNSGAVITNWKEHIKDSFTNELVYPRFSILNPEFTYSLSKIQTAYGIVDVYSHVLEQYMNTTYDNPLQERWAEGIISTLIEIGPKLLNDLKNYDLRADLMFCSTMALNGLLRSGVSQDWATHNIGHQLAAFYDITHGASLAVLTPRWMNEVKGQKTKKMAQYGRRIWGIKGTDKEVILEGIAKTFEFFDGLGIDMYLKDYNIDDKHFDLITERLVKRGIGEIKLNKDQIKNILVNSLK